VPLASAAVSPRLRESTLAMPAESAPLALKTREVAGRMPGSVGMQPAGRIVVVSHIGRDG
jgi:hypothetical protein